MRLLIVTQVVDTDDPILGFFARWIEEFAKHCEKVTVVCLRKGKYALPKHVEVISLGEGHRIRRAFELCSISVGRRADYDAVFSHMSPEFVVAAGWLWRLMGKKIGLWYVHKSVTVWLRIAAFFSTYIFTASVETLRLTSSKKIITGHGIDIDLFKPDISIQRGVHILSAGRLDTSKRHSLVIDAAKQAGRALRIAGDGPELEQLKKHAETCGVDVTFLRGLTQEELQREYCAAAHFIHTSTTGGLDKVVLEAAACDCNVITTVDWLYKYVPVRSVDSTPEAIAHAITDPARASADRVSQVREKHSLPATIKKIIAAYGTAPAR